MKLFCILESLWNLFWYFDFISGHDYTLQYENAYVMVLKCDRCGHESVSYTRRYFEEQKG